MSNPLNFYSVLGLDPSAAAAEIKKAYFRLIREHPPEQDPEGYQKLQEAYDILFDPDKRAAYDAKLRPENPAEMQMIARLQSDIMMAIEMQSWDDAIRTLKQLLLITPQDHEGHLRLGECYMNQAKWDDARRVFEEILKSNPDFAPAWRSLGFCCIALAGNAHNERRQAEKYKQAAAGSFLKAGELVPYDSESWYLAAEAFFNLGQFAEATKYAEKSLLADGELDHQDLDALILLCRICLEQWEFAGYENAAARLKDVIPAHPGANKYVADRFLSLSLFFVREEKLEIAQRLIGTARTYLPADEHLGNVEEYINNAGEIKGELYRINRDPKIPDAIKAVAETVHSLYLEDDPAKKEQVHHAIHMAKLLPPKEFKSSLGHLRKSYPATWSMVSNIFTAVLDVAAAEQEAAAGEPKGIWGEVCAAVMLLAIAARVFSEFDFSSDTPHPYDERRQQREAALQQQEASPESKVSPKTNNAAPVEVSTAKAAARNPEKPKDDDAAARPTASSVDSIIAAFAKPAKPSPPPADPTVKPTSQSKRISAEQQRALSELVRNNRHTTVEPVSQNPDQDHVPSPFDPQSQSPTAGSATFGNPDQTVRFELKETPRPSGSRTGTRSSSNRPAR